MIISDESPFRHLPTLPRQQTLCFDGIRYSVDMAELAYSRLKTNRFILTDAPSDAPERNNRMAFVATVQDAWSVIDSLHRLASLLKQTRDLKQNTPALQAFYRQMSSIEDLRNGVQHLNTEINSLIASDLPVWGDLAWVAQPDPEKQELHCGLLTAGTVFQRDGSNLVNPAGRLFNAPIDHITLTAFGHSVNLSDTMAQVERLVRRLEGSIEESVKQMPDASGHPGSDIVLVAVMDFSGQHGSNEET